MDKNNSINLSVKYTYSLIAICFFFFGIGIFLELIRVHKALLDFGFKENVFEISLGFVSAIVFFSFVSNKISYVVTSLLSLLFFLMSFYPILNEIKNPKLNQLVKNEIKSPKLPTPKDLEKLKDSERKKFMADYEMRKNFYLKKQSEVDQTNEKINKENTKLQSKVFHFDIFYVFTKQFFILVFSGLIPFLVSLSSIQIKKLFFQSLENSYRKKIEEERNLILENDVDLPKKLYEYKTKFKVSNEELEKIFSISSRQVKKNLKIYKTDLEKIRPIQVRSNCDIDHRESIVKWN